ncbi:hypothetical protein C5167_040357 [Papaver somniferum]|uniref:Uncharacterized protein n=1 Tax=Papaver somniferum TaxID=3469 RepID=A0A4Y7IET8_PAPSO|nr:hypothetical protein C5167_040357 [Papaver somniferum]
MVALVQGKRVIQGASYLIRLFQFCVSFTFVPELGVQIKLALPSSLPSTGMLWQVWFQVKSGRDFHKEKILIPAG